MIASVYCPEVDEQEERRALEQGYRGYKGVLFGRREAGKQGEERGTYGREMRRSKSIYWLGRKVFSTSPRD